MRLLGSWSAFSPESEGRLLFSPPYRTIAIAVAVAVAVAVITALCTAARIKGHFARWGNLHSSLSIGTYEPELHVLWHCCTRLGTLRGVHCKPGYITIRRWSHLQAHSLVHGFRVRAPHATVVTVFI
jgi:hypothetical protein